MNTKTRILFGIITKSHTEIALDEMYGLQEKGYICDQFEFGGNKKFKSAFGRFYIILLNATKLLIKAYQFKPNFIYLNSRVEYIASARDCFTIIIVKSFYLRRVHFLIKSHGSNLEVLQSEKFFFRKIVFPLLKDFVRGWLFLSTEELTWIVKNKLLDENKLFLTKNIVRVDKFKIDFNFRTEMNIGNDYTILLFVGRIVEEKGLAYVIDAFAEIKKRHKVFLIIVGDGKEAHSIKLKIKKLDIKKDVIFTGWVDENRAAYYTSNCDILIYPTFAPEGFPMALFNSLAAGLSIITTPIRAAYDYLDEPKNCLWVEPKSSSSITNAVENLLLNVDVMNKMRINNKRKSRGFTKTVVALELSEIFNSIIRNEYDKKFRELKR
jgi:glycosyltransferase involved in cell wall biosynthesis